MYNYKSILNVRSIGIYSNSEVVLKKNGDLWVDDSLKLKNISSFYWDGSKVYFASKEMGTYSYSLPDKEIDTAELVHPLTPPIDNLYLRSAGSIFDDSKGVFVRNIDVYSSISNVKLYTTKRKYSFFQSLWLGENMVYTSSFEDIVIKNLHLPTETTLWQYDTSVLGIEKIGKILGVFGEVLVVVGTVNDEIDTYFPKKDLIFGLDISSGKVLWKTQTAENYEVNNINGLHYGLKPYKEETIVRALGGNHYFELDTQNGRIQTTSLQEQLTLLGLKYLQSSDISSTHLFFKSQSSQGHGLDNCIGSFNYETKKIDWHHVIDELSETGTTIKNGEPKASVNKIYALDSSNTLHIFERVL